MLCAYYYNKQFNKKNNLQTVIIIGSGCLGITLAKNINKSKYNVIVINDSIIEINFNEKNIIVKSKHNSYLANYVIFTTESCVNILKNK